MIKSNVEKSKGRKTSLVSAPRPPELPAASHHRTHLDNASRKPRASYVPFCADAVPQPPYQAVFAYEAVDTCDLYCDYVIFPFAELCRRAAGGEPDAIEYVLKTAIEASRVLEDLAYSKPEPLKEIAAARLFWPFLLTPLEIHTKSFTDQVRNKFRRIGLGTDSLIGISDRFYKDKMGKGWSVKTPRVRVALAVALCLDENRRSLLHPIKRVPSIKHDYSTLPEWVNAALKLSPFSKGTARSWGKVGWSMLLHRYNEQPETDPNLRELGKTHRKSYLSAQHQKSHVRAGIRQELMEGLEQIAPKVPAYSKHSSHI